ncbi:MAG: T9SS type A sorting domain-containing protein [Bacteroidota bacterium]
MKNALLVLMLLLTTFALKAQTCEPDSTKLDSVNIIDPLPFTPEFPENGIADTACINQPFSFVFTIVVPDTVPVPFGEVTLMVPLDSIVLDTEGAIDSLPEGITYGCNPPNCRFSNDEPFSCIILEGTPTNEADIGSTSLVINALIKTSILDLPFEFPDPTLLPGEYFLHVKPEGSENCQELTGIDFPELGLYELEIAPNPNNGIATLNINSDRNALYQMQIFSLTGQKMQERSVLLFEGENQFRLQMEDLPSGMYLLSLNNGKSQVSTKFIINK